MRETVAEADRPVMLYSIGKDSAVMLHLAKKAFYPEPAAVPAAPRRHDVEVPRHVRAARQGRRRATASTCIVYTNPEAEAQGINPFDHGPLHTDMWKTEGLKQALDKYGFDAAFGGARRDEEKSRAKERVFSFRDRNHRWDPKRQRPELWSLYNVRKNKGESIRVFPLSNWTELDVWQYILREKIEIVPLYFARRAADGGARRPHPDGRRRALPAGRRAAGRCAWSGSARSAAIRCRARSRARPATVEEIVAEMLLTKTSERQGRAIDRDAGSASMEKKKQEGYF